LESSFHFCDLYFDLRAIDKTYEISDHFLSPLAILIMAPVKVHDGKTVSGRVVGVYVCSGGATGLFSLNLKPKSFDIIATSEIGNIRRA
jgi:hypothetical protein